MRVAISAAILDSDVREAVGDETLADVTIGFESSNVATVTLVQSAADVEAVRREFRKAYGLLRNARPNLDVLHLFVAAPASICFAIGQELDLRNAPAVQTYRHRKSEEGPSQRPAIILTAAGEETAPVALTEEKLRVAAHPQGGMGRCRQGGRGLRGEQESR